MAPFRGLAERLLRPFRSADFALSVGAFSLGGSKVLMVDELQALSSRFKGCFCYGQSRPGAAPVVFRGHVPDAAPLGKGEYRSRRWRRGSGGTIDRVRGAVEC